MRTGALRARPLLRAGAAAQVRDLVRERVEALPQAHVRVVCLLVEGPLGRFAGHTLVVDLLGDLGLAAVHAAHALVNGADQARDRVELLAVGAQRLPQLPGRGADLGDLVPHGPGRLDRPVQIVPDIRLVVVLDLLLGGLGGAAGLYRGRQDV
nr:MAG TPA: hypothetical protein [Caudoviricetes sp.]